MIEYATLPRTPKGNLTAASKRAIEAERREQDIKRAEQYKRDRERRALVAELVDASDALEAFDGDVSAERPETDRESRQYDRGFDKGEKSGEYNAREFQEGAAFVALERAISRLEFGLDGDISVLEILESIRREIEA